MSTKPPEPSPAQIDQWWAETLGVHAVNPRPAFMQLARIAYAAGWKARAAVKDSSVVGPPPTDHSPDATKMVLPPAKGEVGGGKAQESFMQTSQLSTGVAELFPPGDEEIKAWADSCDCVPPETLVDEDDWDDGYGLIFRPAQFYATVRAALARWGRPVPPPAEGEVAQLVRVLRLWADHYCEAMGIEQTADRFARAADLLERQGAPVPVAVSERLPGAEDCSAEGRCWAWRGFDPENDDDGEFWQLIRAERLSAQLGGGWTHWLPAHSLPLPSGEVGG